MQEVVRCFAAGFFLEVLIDNKDNKTTDAKKLRKIYDQTSANIVELERKLSDPVFLSRAPSAIVEKDKYRLAALMREISKWEAADKWKTT